MGFNLSKSDERFDLSKSSNDDSQSSSSATNSRNTANDKNGSDKTVIFFIAIAVFVVIINASLWYHVMSSASNPVSSIKSISSEKTVQ